jgi:SAM-dependent methyltransferase
VFAPYNNTWYNERQVELPVFKRVYDQHRYSTVLEVGNVLSHYYDTGHDVVDKYEDAPGVDNVDVTDYHPGRQYDLILSISTLEHVGYDEPGKTPEKSVDAVNHLKDLLTPGGTLVFSAPLGYNPYIDRHIQNDAFNAEYTYMERSPDGWHQITQDGVGWATSQLRDSGGYHRTRYLCFARCGGDLP